MSLERAFDEPSSLLPPGTEVDGWRVVEHHRQGAYGAIYRALRIGQEEAGPVALKIALYPWDPRFAREGELLSRVRHPSVPRLLGRGVWRPASGVEHPYLIMEWVEGTPLYEWARQQAPTTPQVLPLLLQLAQALAATHAIHAVHRDVKGDNILVRHSDGRAVLIDFGSGHYEGASRLTWQSPPPGTPAYHSPEAALFVIRSVRSPYAYFQATPADDLFALGVTAYRLVMGAYPPSPKPSQDKDGTWRLKRLNLRPLLERNSRVEPPLRECILRLLSMDPPARGTTAELVRSLGPTAGHTEAPLAPLPHTASQPVPILADAASPVARLPSCEVTPLEQPVPRTPTRAREFWLALTAVGLAWFLGWSMRPSSREPQLVLGSSQEPVAPEKPDVGSAAVGDSSAKAPQSSEQAPARQEAIAQDTLPNPQPRQTQPDGKGLCPSRKQVAFKGFCWLEQPGLGSDECKEQGYTYLKGRCYAPVFTPQGKPQPTSAPSSSQ